MRPIRPSLLCHPTRHELVLRPAAAAQPRDSSKQDSKYGPADRNGKFKTTRFSDHVDKHRRGNRGHGGKPFLPTLCYASPVIVTTPMLIP